MLLFQDWSSEQTWFSVLWHNTHGSWWAPDKPSNCTLELGKPMKFLICPRTFLYYLLFWWIVMLGSISCGKSLSIFNTTSFTLCRCIIGIRVRNFNKPKHFATIALKAIVEMQVSADSNTHEHQCLNITQPIFQSIDVSVTNIQLILIVDSFQSKQEFVEFSSLKPFQSPISAQFLRELNEFL